MSVAPDTDVAGEPAANPTEAEPAITEPEAAEPTAEAAETTTEAILADSDDASFRLLLDRIDGGLVADRIQDALDQELDCETLIERLTEALADEGSTDAELTRAAPVLAAIAVRGLLHDGEDELPEPDVAAGLARAMTAAIGSLIETGIPDAIQALPGLMRQIEHRAARDRIGGADLIPVLGRIAERVALDPDLVRRLSGRGQLSRPLATAAYGAAAFRQQPMRCRIDGPVEIIIVRR
jgi:hypothetical protein